MRNKTHSHFRKKSEHHSKVSTGLFFILLGLALLIITNDFFNLGGVQEYLRWESVLIFIGLISLVNLHFVGGFLLISAGVWFLLDDIFIVTPEYVKVFFWPLVIILTGLSFILSSLFRRNRKY